MSKLGLKHYLEQDLPFALVRFNILVTLSNKSEFTITKFSKKINRPGVYSNIQNFEVFS